MFGEFISSAFVHLYVFYDRMMPLMRNCNCCAAVGRFHLTQNAQEFRAVGIYSRTGD